jgi:pyruvate,water dikinase
VTLSFVRTFDEIALPDRPTVGGKGASLGELTKAGIAVPPGFVVCVETFRQFIAVTDPENEIGASVAELAADDHASISNASAAIRQRLESAPLPAPIADAIVAEYESLGEGTVAVRSSATSEDSEDASFAGLQDTFLWLRDKASVLHHVRACWASLYSVESIAYRRRLKMPEDGLAMAVVVQRMVDARAAGVMFTRSPATGDRSVIVIEGSYGLGSCIVSGEVTPDKFVVNKVTGDVIDRAISQKTMQHLPDRARGGVLECAVDDTQQNEPCLTDAEIAALFAVGKNIERHYGKPQDIEWAISQEDEIFLLQSRPETVWSRRDATPVAKPARSALDHVFAAFGGRAAP